MINFKDIVIDTIFDLDINLNKEEIRELIEIPPNPEMGDFSFTCFKLSKTLRKAPNIISEELVNRINIDDKRQEPIDLIIKTKNTLEGIDISVIQQLSDDERNKIKVAVKDILEGLKPILEALDV